MLEKQRLLNTYVNNVTLDETLDEIDGFIRERKKSYIVAINVDVVMKMENDDYLRRISNEADMVLVDGKPLIWISKLYKRQIKEKVSGSDLVPQLCKRAADKNYSIFIIGGKDGVAEQAKKKLEQKLPGIRIVATRVDGTPEIVRDGVDGYLIDPKSSEQIAEAVCKVIENDEKREQMEMNAKERYVQEFSFVQLAEKYSRFYEEL